MPLIHTPIPLKKRNGALPKFSYYCFFLTKYVIQNNQILPGSFFSGRKYQYAYTVAHFNGLRYTRIDTFGHISFYGG